MPRVVANVTYTFDFKRHGKSQEERIQHAKDVYQIPGMLWKIWLRDDQSGRGGGVFLFEDRASADAWMEARKTRSFSPDVKDLEAELFEVDEAVSAYTNAPLLREALAGASHGR